MADDHGWPGDAPGDAALGWGFTQVVRPPIRQPLGELCGNAQLPSPGCDRPSSTGACEPLVVHDVSDSGSGSGSDDEEEVGFACVTQLYDRHEEAPPEEEEDGDDEGGDPAHWISEHDVGCAPHAERGCLRLASTSHTLHRAQPLRAAGGAGRRGPGF